ncbi:unnamed protein product, partial [Ectocarpus sp. 12 AP-2014]
VSKYTTKLSEAIFQLNARVIVGCTTNVSDSPVVRQWTIFSEQLFACAVSRSSFRPTHTSPASRQAFACKTCRKIFVKDLSIYGTEDSACPHCETVFVLPAVTPEAKVAQLALSILAAEMFAEVSKF